jgi:hypothetical protein
MASPFASMHVSDPIPLPFDEGQWVKVRKLTGEEYEAAQVAHRIEFVSGDKWAGVFRQALENGPSSAAVKKALANPLTGFDRYALVRAGLLAWSYPNSITPVKAKVAQDGAPDIVVDAIKDLDDDAVEFIALEVLKRTKPALFLATPAEAEADQKKD